MKYIYIMALLIIISSLSITSVNAAVYANYTLFGSNNATDTSGNGFNLVSGNATVTSVGSLFNGSTYYIRGNLTQISYKNNFSIFFSFFKPTNSSSGSIIANSNGANDRFAIDLSATTGLRGGLYDGSTFFNRGSFPNSAVLAGEWNCGAYIRNTSNNATPTFILNSAPSTEVNTPSTGGNSNFTIGTRDDKNNNNLTGEVSSILIYDTVMQYNDVINYCNNLRVQTGTITVTDTNLSGSAPQFGANIKSFQFIGEDYWIDTNGDNVLDTAGNFTWHRQQALAMNITSWRADARLDKSTAPNTFVGTNGSLYNVRTAQTAIEWMYANNMSLTLTADYMPGWLSINDSNCTSNHQYCSPTNYTTWGQLLVDYINNITNNNATLRSIISVEVWNEPYLFWQPDGTTAYKISEYINLYNATKIAINAAFPSMKVKASTVYTQSLGLSFSTGIMGNLTANGLTTDCIEFHDYDDANLTTHFINETNFIASSGYGSCIQVTEFNSLDANNQVNYSVASSKYITEPIMYTMNNVRNLTAYYMYQWSDAHLYNTSNSSIFESWPKRYSILSEPLLDNAYYYAFEPLRQISAYHGYGKTNLQTTDNNTLNSVIASRYNSTGIAVTILNKNTGKNVTLTFSNTSFTHAKDIYTLQTYTVTAGSTTVLLRADNTTTLLVWGEDTTVPTVTVTSPTNTTYTNNRNIPISFSAIDGQSPLDWYWFGNGTNNFTAMPQGDWSGFGNNLILQGSPLYDTANNAYIFTGVSGGGSLNTTRAIVGTTTNISFEVRFMFNNSVATARERPVEGGKFHNATFSNQFYLDRENGANTWSASFSYMNGTANSCGSPSFVLSANTLYDIIATYNGTHTLVYSNGILVANKSTCTLPVDSNTELASLNIGSTGGYTNGSVYKVKLFNKTLSYTEVLTVYNNGSISPLISYYPFSNNGTGTRLSQFGSRTLTFYSNDTSNNVGSTAVSFSVTDTVQPSILMVNPINGSNFASTTVNLTFNVNDNVSGLDSVWYDNGTNNTVISNLGGNFYFNYSNNIILSSGNRTIYVYANDTQGNIRKEIVNFGIGLISYNVTSPGQNITIPSTTVQSFSYTLTNYNNLTTASSWFIDGVNQTGNANQTNIAVTSPNTNGHYNITNKVYSSANNIQYSWDLYTTNAACTGNSTSSSAFIVGITMLGLIIIVLFGGAMYVIIQGFSSGSLVAINDVVDFLKENIIIVFTTGFILVLGIALLSVAAGGC